ncbi:MAG: MarR family transcriptional regulator [Candidatus Cellulosilyticum pullistercoris]|uniref:MarR family transcriptional regulator n=1 Tax=Candidatus Cellulosilyticum pullistercoris TaxID=2838521 RepID=A0A9E2KDT8_9FIRM|nr:MarR family transcriptional regulator [Candidatus Cellulosilyticum pullistercoris]
MEKIEKHELLALMEKCGHFLYHRRGGKRGQGKILKILLTEGEITQKELQERLGIQSGSMSEIVLKLEGNGLICRAKDEADKRKIKLKITEEGKRFFEEKHKTKIEQEKKLFNALTKEEQVQLKVLLTKLFDDWESNFEKVSFEHERKCCKKHAD